VAGELKAALLKLAASLPAARRGDEEQARRRIYLDPAGWAEDREPAPHLSTLHQAVWERRRLKLTCALPFDARATWLVEPYGLVAKANTWYLVCGRGGQVRALKVASVLEVGLTGDRFDVPPRFDLAVFWQGWCASLEENRPQHRATVRIAPELVRWLPQLIGERVREELGQAEPADEGGWIRLTMVFESLEEARARILSLGGAAEVVAPTELRESVADFARQIVSLYPDVP